MYTNLAGEELESGWQKKEKRICLAVFSLFWFWLFPTKDLKDLMEWILNEGEDKSSWKDDWHIPNV